MYIDDFYWILNHCSFLNEFTDFLYCVTVSDFNIYIDGDSFTSQTLYTTDCLLDFVYTLSLNIDSIYFDDLSIADQYCFIFIILVLLMLFVFTQLQITKMSYLANII